MSATRDIPTADVVVLDNVGLLAVTDGTAHYVTSCCRAAVTGSASHGPEVLCKGCYKGVDSRLARSWEVTDVNRWLRWVHDNLARDYALHEDNRTSGIPESMYASVLRHVGVLPS